MSEEGGKRRKTHRVRASHGKGVIGGHVTNDSSVPAMQDKYRRRPGGRGLGHEQRYEARHRRLVPVEEGGAGPQAQSLVHLAHVTHMMHVSRV